MQGRVKGAAAGVAQRLGDRDRQSRYGVHRIGDMDRDGVARGDEGGGRLGLAVGPGEVEEAASRRQRPLH